MGDDTYGYAYDPIGNRMSATENTEATGYTANGLNPYSQISAPSVPSVVHPVCDANGQQKSAKPKAQPPGDRDFEAARMRGARSRRRRRGGNCNVTGYVENWSGSTVAAFAYDAFGNTISEAVSPGLHLPHRFSTKYLDHETGMSYYGYRFYSPELGRWPSLDPIEERGGLNLYGFVGNEPVNRWDWMGLKAASPFEFVGARDIVQDGGIYLGLWFGTNDYLDRHPAYALFTVSLAVDVAECKTGGRTQIFNGSHNFFASRAMGDKMLSSNEIYLNPLNSRDVEKNKNGSTGGWRNFITSKKGGRFCTRGKITISIKWCAMMSNPFDSWESQRNNYEPWWHDQNYLPNAPELPQGFDSDSVSFASGTQAINVSWKCGDANAQEKTAPVIEAGFDRAKNK